MMLRAGKLRAMVVVGSIEGYAVVALVELLVVECPGHCDVSWAAHALMKYLPRPRRHLHLILKLLDRSPKIPTPSPADVILSSAI